MTSEKSSLRYRPFESVPFNQPDKKYFFVKDTEAENKDKAIVTFHTGNGHGLEEQRQRCIDYAKFMNDQEEAMKEAAGKIAISQTVARRFIDATKKEQGS